MADNPEQDFDVGDTELYIDTSARVPKPEASDAPLLAAEQPRNADGTFAKVLAPGPAILAHPDYLVQQARDYGFDDADMAAMTTEALGRAVFRAHRAQEAIRGQMATERTVSEATTSSPPPERPVEDEDKLDLDEEQYDPGLLKVIKAQARELKALKARDSQREAKSAEEQLDQAFESLGEKFHKLTGQGPASELTGKPELKRRIAVLREAGVDLNRLPPVARLKAQVKAAAELLYPALEEKPAEKPNPYETNGHPTPEQWREAGLARPTQRAGAAEPDGTEKAVRNAEKRLREAGVPIVGGVGDSEIMDGLF